MNDQDEIAVGHALDVLNERWSSVGPWNLPYRILLLAKMIDRTTAEHVRETGDLSLAQWRTLTHLANLQPCSASRIAGVAVVDRAEVSRALGALEARGLVSRESNPRNRKSNLVSLTKKGQQLHDAIRGERGAFFREWVADLSEEDRTVIDDGLQNIARRIVKRSPDVLDQ